MSRLGLNCFEKFKCGYCNRIRKNQSIVALKKMKGPIKCDNIPKCAHLLRFVSHTQDCTYLASFLSVSNSTTCTKMMFKLHSMEKSNKDKLFGGRKTFRNVWNLHCESNFYATIVYFIVPIQCKWLQMFDTIAGKIRDGVSSIHVSHVVGGGKTILRYCFSFLCIWCKHKTLQMP